MSGFSGQRNATLGTLYKPEWVRDKLGDMHIDAGSFVKTTHKKK